MVSNYPQRLTATAAAARLETSGSTASVMNRFALRVGQFLCAMRGHDSVLHFEGNRVMMRCTSCGHDSPGWEISGQGPRVRYEGDARRHTLQTPRLVLRKSA